MLDKESRAGGSVKRLIISGLGVDTMEYGLAGGGFFFAMNMGVGTLYSTTTNLVLAGGTTAASSMRVTAGVAPTSPANGDIWFDGTNLKIQIGGVTKTFTMA